MMFEGSAAPKHELSTDVQTTNNKNIIFKAFLELIEIDFLMNQCIDNISKAVR